MRAGPRIVAIALVDAVMLYIAWPDWKALVAGVSHPAEWIALAGSDGVTATLAATGVWVVAAWVAMALLTTTLAALPGRLGLLAAIVSRALVPGVIQRMVASATGLSILMTPAIVAAATPSGGSGTPSPASISAPAWPSTPPPGTPSSRAPRPEWPTANGSASPPRTEKPRVIVQPGDTLWAIAAGQLGPRASASAIAAEWPRWFAANRAVIGPNPNHLTPGQVLSTPDRHSAEETP